jgi:alkaline phosphatase D
MASRPGPHPDRRALLAGAAALAGCSVYRPRAVVPISATLRAGPFTLGVASGDPLPDGFVIWTRLAPEPLHGGGMPPAPVAVRWQVASDERFASVVREGWTIATAALAHSVHVEVGGLDPARWYWYRFQTGAEISPVGRARTAPAPGARTARLRFATVSCQHWQSGHYTGFSHLAAEDLDFVIHLGDYIYEFGIDPTGVRWHDGPAVRTLAGYRNRYALYKSDPLLQAAHAAFPWMVIWDDHEVIDDYAGPYTPGGGDPRRFLLRRAAAYQAFYEHLPLRLTARPGGPDMLLFRRLAFGDLLDLHLLDTRQYRNVIPPRDDRAPRPAAQPESATMLGARQEAWLKNGLSQSQARWNALAQGIWLSQRVYPPADLPAPLINVDKWDGFPAARRRLTRFLAERRPPNPVVLTGDDHRAWVADVKADFDDPASPTVATELVGAAISSSGDGTDMTPEVMAILASHPHLKYHLARRGYLRCQLDQNRWQTDVRAMPFVTRPGAPIATAASFVIEAGHPGAQRSD